MKRFFLCVFVLICSCLYILGQDSVSIVQPLQLTNVRRPIYNVYLFCEAGSQTNGNVWTAANNGEVTHLYGRYLTLGGTIETKFFNFLIVGYSLGYKYEPYSYSKNLLASSRFNTHWISNDILASMGIIGVGFKSDIFLGGSLTSNNNFDMIGINNHCFNKVAMAGYLNFSFRTTNLKLDLNMGIILKKKLNVDKLAYYNMHKSYADGIYWEAKVSYRIFTSGNRLKSQSLIYE